MPRRLDERSTSAVASTRIHLLLRNRPNIELELNALPSPPPSSELALALTLAAGPSARAREESPLVPPLQDKLKFSSRRNGTAHRDAPI